MLLFFVKFFCCFVKFSMENWSDFLKFDFLSHKYNEEKFSSIFILIFQERKKKFSFLCQQSYDFDFFELKNNLWRNFSLSFLCILTKKFIWNESLTLWRIPQKNIRWKEWNRCRFWEKSFNFPTFFCYYFLLCLHSVHIEIEFLPEFIEKNEW